MIIVWDEPKRLANIEKHSFDFADVNVGFFRGALVKPAKLGRFGALGTLNGKKVALVFARLGTEGISLTSLRQANDREGTNT